MTVLILLHVLLVLLTGYLAFSYLREGSYLGFLWLFCLAIWITVLIMDFRG